MIYNFKLLFLLFIAFFSLIGCHSYKDRNIFVSNQLSYPITIDYYAYNVKYLLTNRKFSQKDKNALMYYKPLYCKKCKIKYGGDNFVSIILPPNDTVAISRNFEQIYYRNDILVIGETRIYPTQLQYNIPSGFELLNYLKPYGSNMILSINDSNINAISFIDSINYPCKLFEFKDSTKTISESYEFCKLLNDTIGVYITKKWLREHNEQIIIEYDKRYYHKQRELLYQRSYLFKSTN